MNIEFIASNKQGQKYRADNAKQAVDMMLQGSKCRTFDVREYRDGCFKMSFNLGGATNINPEYNCFSKSFKSRKEASEFLAQDIDN